MLILGICDNVDALKAIRIVRIVITIIKIIVPILLIVSCAISAVKAEISNDKELTSKMAKEWLRKMVAAVIIFFVPTMVGLISKLSYVEYVEPFNCIKNATTASINKMAANQAVEALEVVENTLHRSDLYNARVAISNVDDVETYNELAKRFKNVEEKIKKKEEEKKQKLEEDVPEGIVGSNTGWWWPIGSKETTTVNGLSFANGKPSATSITAYFGGNDSVHRGLGGGHGAIDIGASRGSNVIASKSGTVVYPTAKARIDYPEQSIRPDANGKYNCRGLVGNYVIIDHGNGIKTTYKHLYKNTITVRAGDHVEQGQVIGLSGSSGCSTGPHLHFQMEINGKRVDPLKYVSSSKPRP